jgi:hypothetical protein
MELKTSGSKALRCHRIEWGDPKVTEKAFGLNNEEDIVSEPLEINVSANESGRIHGFFVGAVFFIRWFDPDHNLYR